MNLEIVNNKGVFEIHGDFINEHTNQVATFFNNLLDTYYEIVICLKHVKQIDETAINVMKFISNKAKRRSKILFVLGNENKRIYSQLNKANLIYVFGNDYDFK
ncbi:hypothetical protein Q4Q39_04620 [Flavivirga amylovorans]|uniref:STAS domain-containing protein n=1 Tax=Flavivirga amylovorans TaxID=870486 RepID=A0ABT8WYB2_9FLAO|nr:STAS domain-containing protein [Flavivirga amylovorans]MDO5986685.1 hypothetical protein [Flavivirga amylovorans]